MSIFHHSILSELKPDASLYFVGIGGISMCGLAELTKAQGYNISGSDMHASEHTEHLQHIGIPVTIGQTAANIDRAQPDLLVYSAAVPLDNPELLRAREQNIPCAERGDFLGWLTREFNRVVNIAGTHGKTTTTAMTSLILLENGCEPTVHLGALFAPFGDSTVHLGKASDLLVSEACEYKRSFLHFVSTTAVILNIDGDHLDYFGTIDNVIQAFAVFADQTRDDGCLIVPFNGAHIHLMLQELRDIRQQAGRPMPRVYTFGARSQEAQAGQPDIYYDNLTYVNGLPHYDVIKDGQFFAHIELNVPGLHNVMNSLAAIAAATANGADAAICTKVLAEYQGAEGRFTHKGTYKGAAVITDYAHHPTAARVTLEAAGRIPHRKLWVVFQPLTYGRVKVLFDDFVSVLQPLADVSLVEIYSDREKDTLGMSSKLLVQAINKAGGHAQFYDGYAAVHKHLKSVVQADDMILFLGPEDVRTYGDRLVEEPEAKA
ncbi:UDP-N-acetylmuramate--L-alanine ligase [Oscillospiraceae bacterium HV4-5-C5C]|nr:UDP-N-acetylmuramate--L-alanine ligase [Oscillospiraceae bacterium HV4-5-C5C]